MEKALVQSDLVFDIGLRHQHGPATIAQDMIPGLFQRSPAGPVLQIFKPGHIALKIPVLLVDLANKPVSLGNHKIP